MVNNRLHRFSCKDTHARAAKSAYTETAPAILRSALDLDLEFGLNKPSREHGNLPIGVTHWPRKCVRGYRSPPMPSLNLRNNYYFTNSKLMKSLEIAKGILSSINSLFTI